MKTKIFTLLFLSFAWVTFGQQWNGSNSSNGNIFRNGNVGIGTNTPLEKLDINGKIKSKGSVFESVDENIASGTSSVQEWLKYSLCSSLGKETNLFNDFERRFNFYDLPATSGIGNFKSGALFTVRDVNFNNRLLFSAEDIGESRFAIYDKFGYEVFKVGNMLSSNNNNPTNQNISFLHLLQPNSRVAVGTWVFHKPDYQLTVMGKGWFESDLVTTGKIGVGVETGDIPQQFKLAVSGKIICEEVKVQLQTDWPDYVFDKDYKLLSLQEVELYINKNGHLEGVPSKTEVLKNGIDLSEMNSVLLKKVEELTLYTIEQHRSIQSQKKEIKDLNQKINLLLNKIKKIELEN